MWPCVTDLFNHITSSILSVRSEPEVVCADLVVVHEDRTSGILVLFYWNNSV